MYQFLDQILPSIYIAIHDDYSIKINTPIDITFYFIDKDEIIKPWQYKIPENLLKTRSAIMDCNNAMQYELIKLHKEKRLLICTNPILL